MKNLAKFLQNNTICFIVLLVFAICSPASAQPPTGQWDTTATGKGRTTTDSALGVGIKTPLGWQEIKYCNDQQYGLIITKADCNIWNLSGNDISRPTFDFKLDTLTQEGGGSNTFTPPITFNLSGYNTSGAKPLIWARTANPASFVTAASGAYTTRFIVTPYGRSGFNIENPRATLDIKSLGGYNVPAVIIGRQKLLTIDKTQHIHFVPLLSQYGYNRLSKQDDQGIFFTDGMNSLGSNLDGALVIGPWMHSDSLSPSGIRIDSKGNVGIGTNITGTYKLAVNGSLLVKNEIKISSTLISWPDNVFRDYKLGLKPMSLYDVETFILKYEHLPEVPSEAQVKEEGINTAEMLAILLKKIEELTLQNIQQQKEIDALKSKSQK